MKQTKKSAKIAVAAFVILLAVTAPVYVYMRQNSGTEGSIQIKGAVSNPKNVTYSELKAVLPVTVQVTLSSSSHISDNGVFNYTGVSLQKLLENAQIFENASSVYFQAADGYGATIPIQDIMQNGKAILAYEKEGEPIKALSEGGEGPMRLIIGTDQFGQRWIKGVTVIEAR